MATEPKPASLKEKARHELVEYGINIVYLTLVFAAFTVYRRVLLAEYDIVYTHYWVAVIEAVVLGKVIMLGAIVRLGRGLEDKSLIFPTLYKTVVFTILVALFKMLEHGLKGLWHGVGFGAGVDEMLAKGSNEILANSLVVVVAFIPFFAVKELSRVLGSKTLWTLFFRRAPTALTACGRSP